MSDIKYAIILAAGMGTRLRPLTYEFPKPMTEINGRPFIMNTLEILEKNGIDETVIVVGYLGEKMIEFIGDHVGKMKIKYIDNEIYEKSNSMYSLWLAREYLDKGVILIEGDCVFEEEIIRKLLDTNKTKSYWVVDKLPDNMDGCMLTSNQIGEIIKIQIVREKLAKFDRNNYKSAGILKITPQYGKAFINWLDEEVSKENIGVYYDIVLSKHITEKSMSIFNACGYKWYEIDDMNDLKRAESIFMPTKFIIAIIDGAADYPNKNINDKTPLESADIPTIDHFAQKGKTGMLRTSYPNLPIGSIVANMGILGYNPLRYYPSGRASFECLAQDIFLQEFDIAFRCNIVTVKDNKMFDFTSNNISTIESLKIINNLKLNNDDIEIYSGQGYRNTLIVRNTNILASDLIAKEPHMHIGESIDDILIKGRTKDAKKIASTLNQLMLDSIDQIKLLNKKYKTNGSMIWLWSPSFQPNLPSFFSRYHKSGAVVSGLDFMRGIGEAASMATKEIHGATGDINTDLNEKLKFTKNFLRYNDFVYIHYNAPDEEAHNRDIDKKVFSIEKFDKEFLSPLFKYLKKTYKNNFRIAIMPDHYTLSHNGKHSNEPVPFCMYGKGIENDQVQNYSENEIGNGSDIFIESYEFLDLFFGGEKANE